MKKPIFSPLTKKKFSTLRQMVEEAVAQPRTNPAYRYKKDGKIVDVSFSEFYESIEALGANLTARGFGKSHIACLGENSFPWIETYFTVLLSAGVFVPIDAMLNADQIVFLLNESDTEVLFCSQKMEKIVADRIADLPRIKQIITFERAEDDGIFLSFEKFLEEGRPLPKADYDALRSDEYALKDLVYTSGTTGIAKGVMLTEHNLCSGVYYGLQVSPVAGTCLSVLPYHHTYEAVCDILVAFRSGCTLCINDSLRKVSENLKLFRPDYVYLVPAFAEFFMKSMQNAIRKQGKEKLVSGMLKLSAVLRKIGIDLRRVFFKQLLDGLGGNLTRIVCGGAPIRKELGAFFDGIGISLTGGYGITECSPLVSVNDPSDNNLSSAGHRLPCLSWKIDDPNEEGIGEILVKGDVVMLGYYKRPDLTEEVLHDGWFATGDYGKITEKDEIVITGRKKNIIVLSNGKNIYPEEIEAKLLTIPYITEVIVKGQKNAEGDETGLAAEIYAAEPNADLSHLKEDMHAALAGFPSYKQIVSYTVRNEPFEKTTTNKIKRQNSK